MKKVILFSFLLFGFMLSSCIKEVEPTVDPRGFMYLQEADKQIHPDGQTLNFDVVSNVSWTLKVKYATEGENWLQLDPLKGKEVKRVKATFGEMSDPETPRKCTLQLHYAGKVTEFEFVQGNF